MYYVFMDLEKVRVMIKYVERSYAKYYVCVKLKITWQGI